MQHRLKAMGAAAPRTAADVDRRAARVGPGRLNRTAGSLPAASHRRRGAAAGGARRKPPVAQQRRPRSEQQPRTGGQPAAKAGAAQPEGPKEAADVALTLAQRLGLVAMPELPLSAAEWDQVGVASAARCARSKTSNFGVHHPLAMLPVLPVFPVAVVVSPGPLLLRLAARRLFLSFRPRGPPRSAPLQSAARGLMSRVWVARAAQGLFVRALRDLLCALQGRAVSETVILLAPPCTCVPLVGVSIGIKNRGCHQNDSTLAGGCVQGRGAGDPFLLACLPRRLVRDPTSRSILQ